MNVSNYTYLAYLKVILLAYLVVLLQANFFSQITILGGQPNLIALFSIFFIITNNIEAGWWWILVGGSLIDLLLPIRFGFNLLPMMLGYLGIYSLSRYVISSYSLAIIAILGLTMVLISESAIIITNNAWQQLARDFLASLIILLPSTITLNRFFNFTDLLIIRRK